MEQGRASDIPFNLNFKCLSSHDRYCVSYIIPETASSQHSSLVYSRLRCSRPATKKFGCMVASSRTHVIGSCFPSSTRSIYRRVHRSRVPARQLGLGNSNRCVVPSLYLLSLLRSFCSPLVLRWVGYPWAPDAFSIASARHFLQHANTMRSICTCEYYGRVRLNVNTLKSHTCQ